MNFIPFVSHLSLMMNFLHRFTDIWWVSSLKDTWRISKWGEKSWKWSSRNLWQIIESKILISSDTIFISLSWMIIIISWNFIFLNDNPIFVGLWEVRDQLNLRFWDYYGMIEVISVNFTCQCANVFPLTSLLTSILLSCACKRRRISWEFQSVTCSFLVLN